MLIDRLSSEIGTLATRQLSTEELRLQHHRAEVYSLAIEVTHRALSELERTEMAIRNLATTRLDTEMQRIVAAEHLVESYSVDNILKLGFAALHSGSTYVTHIGEVEIGQNIDIELRDGTITAEIRNIEHNNDIKRD